MRTLRFLFRATIIETLAIGLIVLLFVVNPARRASQFETPSKHPPTLVIERNQSERDPATRSRTTRASDNAVTSLFKKCRAYLNQHLGSTMSDRR